jgi:hypothetical protein
MQNATLMSHVDTDLVTRERLALVETPDATRSFKPVPHIELIATLEDVLRENRIAIRKEQFALRRDGATLFGVLQLQYQDTSDGMAALGLRTSNNRTMSIQICAGLFRVCLRQHGFSRGPHCPKPQAHLTPLFEDRDCSCGIPLSGTFRQAHRRDRAPEGKFSV